MKVSRRLRKLLVVSFGLLYLGGAGYFGTRRFLRHHGEFGDEPHLLEKLFGPIHVVAALMFVFVLGMFWDKHVRPALRIRENRASGWVFLALVGVLALSGIAILYGGEALVKYAEGLHPWLGLAMLPVLLLHAFKKKPFLAKGRALVERVARSVTAAGRDALEARGLVAARQRIVLRLSRRIGRS